MRQRLIYLAKIYLLTILLFIAAKIVFMLVNHEGHTFTIGDMGNVVLHGLTLDLSTSLYILIIPFLITLISKWWDNIRRLRQILRIYYGIIAISMILAFVADTSLYPFWGFKLDATCLQYLETPAEMRASVSGFYMTIRLFLIIIGGIVIWWLYTHIPLWIHVPSNRSVATIGDLLMIPLFVIGIRGGLDESTTNIGQVYFSQDQFLNHAAVNPVFSFMASFEKTANEIVSYDFFDEKECAQLTTGLFPTKSLLTDTLLTTQRPNVVIILLESSGDIFSPVMPNLRRLKKEGIYFNNCYGNSYRTDRGTISTLSGYPAFPTMSVMKMPKKTASLPAISRSLREEGYQTSYLYGGDINFTNMRSYLIASGWEKLHWKADYTNDEQNSAKWGVRDDITFKTLYNQICKSDTAGQRFLMGYSTLSSHEPWDVPIKHLEDEKLNAFYYLDQCIGNFIQELKNTPFWKDLLIILLPDHGINYKEFDELHSERNHIPFLWIGGAVKEPKLVTKFCNQTDLAATLLAQMGIKHDEFTFSRDVLDHSYTKPFAFHCYNNGFSIIDSTGFTAYDLTGERIVKGQNQSHVKLGKAILQLTSKDLKKR